jgi:hypothetical protein
VNVDHGRGSSDLREQAQHAQRILQQAEADQRRALDGNAPFGEPFGRPAHVLDRRHERLDAQPALLSHACRQLEHLERVPAQAAHVADVHDVKGVARFFRAYFTPIGQCPARGAPAGASRTAPAGTARPGQRFPAGRAQPDAAIGAGPAPARRCRACAAQRFPQRADAGGAGKMAGSLVTGQMFVVQPQVHGVHRLLVAADRAG